jgi:hypothetical protein
MKLRHSAIVHVACACALLLGCVAPKATLAEDPSAEKPKQEPAKTEPANPVPDDGFRIGDLTQLPKETQYRPTNPTLPPKDPGGSAVIVKPPSSPVPKPKP